MSEVKSLDAIRTKIASIKAEIERVESQSIAIPKAHALQRMDAAVDKFVNRAKSTIATATRAAAYNREINLIRTSLDFESAVELLAWIDPASMKKALGAAVSGAYETIDEQMSPEDQLTRLTSLRRELLETERAELMAFKSARANGSAVLARGDMDPAVILGIDHE